MSFLTTPPLAHSLSHQSGQTDEVYIGAGLGLTNEIDILGGRLPATGNLALVTGDIMYTFFKAPFNFTANNVILYCTIAPVAPTLMRSGLVTVSGAAVTYVAQTANYQASLPSSNTVFTKAFDNSIATSYALTRGTIYGIATIQVGGSTLMSIRAAVWSAGAFGFLTPILTGITTGHADLANETVGAGNSAAFWAALS